MFLPIYTYFVFGYILEFFEKNKTLTNLTPPVGTEKARQSLIAWSVDHLDYERIFHGNHFEILS